MNAQPWTDQLPVPALAGRPVRQPRIPRKRNGHRAAVSQFDDERTRRDPHALADAVSFLRSEVVMPSPCQFDLVLTDEAGDSGPVQPVKSPWSVRRATGPNQNFAVLRSRGDMHVHRLVPIGRVEEEAVGAAPKDRRTHRAIVAGFSIAPCLPRSATLLQPPTSNPQGVVLPIRPSEWKGYQPAFHMTFHGSGSTDTDLGSSRLRFWPEFRARSSGEGLAVERTSSLRRAEAEKLEVGSCQVFTSPSPFHE